MHWHVKHATRRTYHGLPCSAVLRLSAASWRLAVCVMAETFGIWNIPIFELRARCTGVSGELQRHAMRQWRSVKRVGVSEKEECALLFGVE